jgi:serine/threonine protein kinase
VTAGSELTPGTLVDRRYRIQCTLGRGGFGRTYLAADERRFNELCVLKEFVPNSQADPVVAQKLRELFQREAAILHKLSHPQIPRFFAGFEEDERLFIAQEYIDGKTYWRLLQERQRQSCTFNQREIVQWLRDLLPVLDYLHTQNIVHRDISPDNIMLPKGRKAPVLIDFGVVKQVMPHLHLANSGDPDDLIQASVSVGKFGYAPYEQIRMGQCSPRSDLYALAVTAVVLLTGKPPNHLIDAKSLEWKWKRSVRLDSRLLHILDTMMADKPQDRYASAQAVLQALQPLYDKLDSLEIFVADKAKSAKAASSVESASCSTVSAIHRLANGKGGRSLRLTREPEPKWATQSTAVTGHLIATQLDAQPDALTPGSLVDAASTKQIDAAAMSAQPTHIEAAIVPAANQQLAEAAIPLKVRTLRSRASWLDLMRAILLQAPHDRLGNSRPPLQISLRQALALGVLALLPIGGAVVGIRSPYIASLCSTLQNCVGEQSAEERYRQAIEQADSADVLTGHARDLKDLQNARQRLADSIAQLNTFSSSTRIYGAANAVLPKYQSLLQTLDRNLEKETRAVQLLNRAEAEAQKAAEQTKVANTLSAFQAAQLQWRRALATLEAIPDGTFVNRQAVARAQEYKARLDAVNLKVAAAMPKSPQKPTNASTTAQPSRPAPERSTTVSATTSATTATTIPAPTPARSQPTASQNRSPQVGPSAKKPQTTARPTNRSNPTPARSTRRPPARSPSPAVAQAQAPQTSPLEIDSRWVAGSFVTSATQTLDNVSIWIDGNRTEADGKFVANLWLQNRSGRGFGFAPLYAESRDASGNTIRSRVLFTGTADMMLEPGEALTGQIYLLDRPAANSRRLTLVIQESTSGNRTFRIPF